MPDEEASAKHTALSCTQGLTPLKIMLPGHPFTISYQTQVTPEAPTEDSTVSN